MSTGPSETGDPDIENTDSSPSGARDLPPNYFDDPQEMMEKSTGDLGAENWFDVELLPDTAEGKDNKEQKIFGANSEVYAGQWPRYMFEYAGVRPKQATWVGYTEERGKLIEIPVEHDPWFKHSAIFGNTGTGKTTLLNNICLQHAWAGHGFCFIDPNGDGVKDLIRKMPQHRLDDIIYIDPVNRGRDRVVGINFLETSETDDEARYETEVQEIISDLKSIVRDESYWGNLMDRVFRNIARGMIRSEKKYTLVDMYYILMDPEYREEFIKDIDDEVVRDYTEQINEVLDNDDLDALLGRLQKYVENRITREIIGHPESSFDIGNAVEEGKIILINNNAPPDPRKFIAVGVIRRIWAAIRSREEIPKHERSPYFLIVDEFDNIASSDMNIQEMLGEARKFRLSLTLCCQQPSQLSDDIERAVLRQCRNVMSFNPQGPDDSRTISKRFTDKDPDDLRDLPDYQFYTRVQYGEGQMSGTIKSKSFPPYPPLRAHDDIDAVINRSLKRYGTDRRSADEIADDLTIDPNQTEEHDEEIRASDDVDIDEKEAITATLAVQLRAAADDEKIHDYRDVYVPIETVVEETSARVDSDVHANEFAQAIENADGKIELSRIEGEKRLRVTESGENSIFPDDTGGQTGGGVGHRMDIKPAFKYFTLLGYRVSVPEQESGEAKPDLIGYVPMDMRAQNGAEMQRKENRLHNEYPDVAQFSPKGRDIHIEVEHSTDSRPVKTIRNLQKATKEGRRCVFCAVPEEPPKKKSRRIAGICNDPPFYSKDGSDGGRVFYGKSLSTGGRFEVENNLYAARKRNPENGRVQWRETPDGQVKAVDQSTGETVMSFDSIDDVEDPDRDDAPAFFRYNSSRGQYRVFYRDEDGNTHDEIYESRDEMRETWQPLTAPLIPENHFDHTPTPDDWDVVMLGNNGIEGQRYVIEDGDEGRLEDIQLSTTSYVDTVTEDDSPDGYPISLRPAKFSETFHITNDEGKPMCAEPASMLGDEFTAKNADDHGKICKGCIEESGFKK